MALLFVWKIQSISPNHRGEAGLPLSSANGSTKPPSKYGLELKTGELTQHKMGAGGWILRESHRQKKGGDIYRSFYSLFFSLSLFSPCCSPASMNSVAFITQHIASHHSITPHRIDLRWSFFSFSFSFSFPLFFAYHSLLLHSSFTPARSLLSIIYPDAE